MAFEKNINELTILFVLLISVPLIASTNIDCGGKSFHCMNSTHFMICVDLGGGVSYTVDDFVIPCPPPTVCTATNRFECEFPPSTTVKPTTTQPVVVTKDIETTTEEYIVDTIAMNTGPEQHLELSTVSLPDVTTTEATVKPTVTSSNDSQITNTTQSNIVNEDVIITTLPENSTTGIQEVPVTTTEILTFTTDVPLTDITTSVTNTSIYTEATTENATMDVIHTSSSAYNDVSEIHATTDSILIHTTVANAVNDTILSEVSNSDINAKATNSLDISSNMNISHVVSVKETTRTPLLERAVPTTDSTITVSDNNITTSESLTTESSGINTMETVSTTVTVVTEPGNTFLPNEITTATSIVTATENNDLEPVTATLNHNSFDTHIESTTSVPKEITTSHIDILTENTTLNMVINTNNITFANTEFGTYITEAPVNETNIVIATERSMIPNSNDSNIQLLMNTTKDTSTTNTVLHENTIATTVSDVNYDIPINSAIVNKTFVLNGDQVTKEVRENEMVNNTTQRPIILDERKGSNSNESGAIAIDFTNDLSNTTTGYQENVRHIISELVTTTPESTISNDIQAESVMGQETINKINKNNIKTTIKSTADLNNTDIIKESKNISLLSNATETSSLRPILKDIDSEFSIVTTESSGYENISKIEGNVEINVTEAAAVLAIEDISRTPTINITLDSNTHDIQNRTNNSLSDSVKAQLEVTIPPSDIMNKEGLFSTTGDVAITTLPSVSNELPVLSQTGNLQSDQLTTNSALLQKEIIGNVALAEDSLLFNKSTKTSIDNDPTIKMEQQNITSEKPDPVSTTITSFPVINELLEKQDLVTTKFASVPVTNRLSEKQNPVTTAFPSVPTTNKLENQDSFSTTISSVPLANELLEKHDLVTSKLTPTPVPNQLTEKEDPLTTISPDPITIEILTKQFQFTTTLAPVPVTDGLLEKQDQVTTTLNPVPVTNTLWEKQDSFMTHAPLPITTDLKNPVMTTVSPVSMTNELLEKQDPITTPSPFPVANEYLEKQLTTTLTYVPVPNGLPENQDLVTTTLHPVPVVNELVVKHDPFTTTLSPDQVANEFLEKQVTLPHVLVKNTLPENQDLVTTTVPSLSTINAILDNQESVIGTLPPVPVVNELVVKHDPFTTTLSPDLVANEFLEKQVTLPHVLVKNTLPENQDSVTTTVPPLSTINAILDNQESVIGTLPPVPVVNELVEKHDPFTTTLSPAPVANEYLEKEGITTLPHVLVTNVLPENQDPVTTTLPPLSTINAILDNQESVIGTLPLVPVISELVVKHNPFTTTLSPAPVANEYLEKQGTTTLPHVPVTNARPENQESVIGILPPIPENGLPENQNLLKTTLPPVLITNEILDNQDSVITTLPPTSIVNELLRQQSPFTTMLSPAPTANEYLEKQGTRTLPHVQVTNVLPENQEPVIRTLPPVPVVNELLVKQDPIATISSFPIANGLPENQNPVKTTLPPVSNTNENLENQDSVITTRPTTSIVNELLIQQGPFTTTLSPAQLTNELQEEQEPVIATLTPTPVTKELFDKQDALLITSATQNTQFMEATARSVMLEKEIEIPGTRNFITEEITVSSAFDSSTKASIDNSLIINIEMQKDETQGPVAAVLSPNSISNELIAKSVTKNVMSIQSTSEFVPFHKEDNYKDIFSSANVSFNLSAEPFINDTLTVHVEEQNVTTEKQDSVLATPSVTVSKAFSSPPIKEFALFQKKINNTISNSTDKSVIIPMGNIFLNGSNVTMLYGNEGINSLSVDENSTNPRQNDSLNANKHVIPTIEIEHYNATDKAHISDTKGITSNTAKNNSTFSTEVDILYNFTDNLEQNNIKNHTFTISKITLNTSEGMKREIDEGSIIPGATKINNTSQNYLGYITTEIQDPETPLNFNQVSSDILTTLTKKIVMTTPWKNDSDVVFEKEAIQTEGTMHKGFFNKTDFSNATEIKSINNSINNGNSGGVQQKKSVHKVQGQIDEPPQQNDSGLGEKLTVLINSTNFVQIKSLPKMDLLPRAESNIVNTVQNESTVEAGGFDDSDVISTQQIVSAAYSKDVPGAISSEISNIASPVPKGIQDLVTDADNGAGIANTLLKTSVSKNALQDKVVKQTDAEILKHENIITHVTKEIGPRDSSVGPLDLITTGEASQITSNAREDMALQNRDVIQTGFTAEQIDVNDIASSVPVLELNSPTQVTGFKTLPLNEIIGSEVNPQSTTRNVIEEHLVTTYNSVINQDQLSSTKGISVKNTVKQESETTGGSKSSTDTSYANANDIKTSGNLRITDTDTTANYKGITQSNVVITLPDSTLEPKIVFLREETSTYSTLVTTMKNYLTSELPDLPTTLTVNVLAPKNEEKLTENNSPTMVPPEVNLIQDFFINMNPESIADMNRDKINNDRTQNTSTNTMTQILEDGMQNLSTNIRTTKINQGLSSVTVPIETGTSPSINPPDNIAANHSVSHVEKIDTKPFEYDTTTGIPATESTIKVSTTDVSLSPKDQISTDTPTTIANFLDFDCQNRLTGKYGDNHNCKKFYTCSGTRQPIVGFCPTNTVFSEVKKHCTRDLSQCIRNNEFICPMPGRYADYVKPNVYYICIKKNEAFLRYKLQCGRGFVLNKMTVRCYEKISSYSPVDYTEKTIAAQSTTETVQPEEEATDKSIGDKKKRAFECEEEGKFPDPYNCRGYYICKLKDKSDETYRRKHKQCDSDEVFHKEKKKCVDANSSECRYCDSLEDNIYYIQVRTSGHHFLTYKLQCQTGYYLNAISGHCMKVTDTSDTSILSSDDSESSNDEMIQDNEKPHNNNRTFECEEEGRFSDPHDCRKYYICKYKHDSERKFKRKHRKCDKHEVFDENKQECVFSKNQCL